MRDDLQRLFLKNVKEKFNDLGRGAVRAFADEMNVHSSQVSRWINGGANITLGHVQMFCEHFECDPAELLSE